MRHILNTELGTDLPLNIENVSRSVPTVRMQQKQSREASSSREAWQEEGGPESDTINTVWAPCYRCHNLYPSCKSHSLTISVPASFHLKYYLHFGRPESLRAGAWRACGGSQQAEKRTFVSINKNFSKNS